MPAVTRIFQLLARVPLPWMQCLGAILGWVVWVVSPAYRRTFVTNVKASGIASHLAKPAIAAAGMVVSELPWVWMRPHSQTLKGLVQFDGAEHFEAAMRAGKGVIIMSPHIGSWEIGAQAIAEKFGPEFGDMVVLFRPARKAFGGECQNTTIFKFNPHHLEWCAHFDTYLARRRLHRYLARPSAAHGTRRMGTVFWA
jgi:KDO2-lipid IV(A) lauroyltransferase